VRVFDRVPVADGGIPHRLFNIGNHRPEPLMRFIEVLAAALGTVPKMELLPMQAGDVHATYADISDIRREYGWSPTTSIDEGLPRLVRWYRDFYRA
jgi:UDP-glucuronate 4-epimerase